MSGAATPSGNGRLGGWRLSRMLVMLFLVSGMFLSAATIAAVVSYENQAGERRALLQRIEPSQLLTSDLLTAYVNEETGVRGYALSHQALFLEPYQSGQQEVSSDDRQLLRLVPPGSAAARLLGIVHQRADRWTTQYALPAISASRPGGHPGDSTAAQDAGKVYFDQLRTAFGDLQADLRREGSTTTRSLQDASDQLGIVLLLTLIGLIVAGALIAWALRRSVLQPLQEVGRDAQTVTAGDLVHQVTPRGPVEIADLARDIEAMRNRVFAEVTAAREAESKLAELNAELTRSNEDLEQFAYVASHDLQEPLRKVASFCQLLEQRYRDQLDERGVQYIDFAVDGAKRMQVLISDLLAFSRIGRSTDRLALVDLADCVAQAERNLAGAVESTGATVEVTGQALPTVNGDQSLLTALFQNLIGNAIKFHGDQPPRVTVDVGTDGADWLLSVCDNGIGIEPRFAEKIFVIFQRLHSRETYSGTGIGLAMCRKIVEFHGGRIWLDTDHHPGACFHFTLPQLTMEETDDPEPAAVV